MIKVWGNADSVNVQKVLWICDELDINTLRIDAGRHYGIVRTPEFLKLNPNGLVPTIEDDGCVVWESNAIVRYLAAKYSEGAMWPREICARADADRWMDWSAFTLWPTLLPLFRAYLRTPSEQRDALAIASFRQEACEVLAILDHALNHATYIGGDALTIGDIALGPPVWRWMALPIDRPNFPALDRWFRRLAVRAAFQRTVMVPLT